jgi:hypothetical protein
MHMICLKIQCFQQGSQSIEDYYQELQKDIICCKLLGKNDDAMAHFYSALHRDIQDIHDH